MKPIRSFILVELRMGWGQWIYEHWQQHRQWGFEY